MSTDDYRVVSNYTINARVVCILQILFIVINDGSSVFVFNRLEQYFHDICIAQFEKCTKMSGVENRNRRAN